MAIIVVLPAAATGNTPSLKRFLLYKLFAYQDKGVFNVTIIPTAHAILMANTLS